MPQVPPPAPAPPQPATAPPPPEPPADVPTAQTKPTPATHASKPEAPVKSRQFPVMFILLLLLVAGAVAYFVSREMKQNAPAPAILPHAVDLTAREANYIRIGWQKDASRLLRNFMAADSSAKKLPFILNGEGLAPRIKDFYGESAIDDSDTPASAFSVYELSEEDHKRGLFMMTYDQPPQFDMKEFFRPLATLEVQYGIDEADLLLGTLARAGNFAMEPLRVHAFFKQTPGGLKLDWEIFAQTKYRTFRNFAELPETRQKSVFRVFIGEDVPDKSQTEAGTCTYRLSDPANTEDTARVNVKVDSEIGRALSALNWRGTKEGHPLTRTATVELSWAGEKNAPQMEISRFICWEFLGLGGEETKSPAAAK
jgi:hypothetical protein